MAQLINFVFTPRFKKQYQKLPINIQNKFTKQLKLLSENYRYPSLQTRKMGSVDQFAAGYICDQGICRTKIPDVF